MTKTELTTASECTSSEICPETDEPLKTVEDSSEKAGDDLRQIKWSGGSPELRDPYDFYLETLNIVVRPLGEGLFAALLGERVLCKRRAPFLAAARVLQSEGVPDNTLLSMTHEGSSIVAMRSTVGEAAGRIVHETSSEGPKFKRYRPMTDKMLRRGRGIR